MITLTHYLVLGALLFGISAMGIFMNRKTSTLSPSRSI